MKKEITGWVYLDEDKNFTTMNFHQRIPDNFSEMKNVVKASLTVYLPEKKIEISESEFDQAFSKKDAEDMSWDNFKYCVKRKLFGD